MSKLMVSVCIPTCELINGTNMLTQLFQSIVEQSFDDYEIIVSDQSVSADIKNLCRHWNAKINLVYITEHHRGSGEENLNNAIRQARGKYIKIMYQDDFFVDNTALAKMVERLELGPERWVAMGCLHCNEDDTKNLFKPHIPKWIEVFNLALGNNTIGSPSVTMFENNGILIDEKLIWLMDCEFYYRLRRATTTPALLLDTGIAIRLRKDSITNTMITPELIKEEKLYIKIKHQQNISPDITKLPIMYKRLQGCGLIEVK